MAEARLVGRELLSGRRWRRACRQGRVGSQAWSVWFPLFQGPQSCCDVAAEAGDPPSLGGVGRFMPQSGACCVGQALARGSRCGWGSAWPVLPLWPSSHRTYLRIRRGS